MDLPGHSRRFFIYCSQISVMSATTTIELPSLETLRAKATALIEASTDAAVLWAVAMVLEKSALERLQLAAPPETYTSEQLASIARGSEQLRQGQRIPAASVIARMQQEAS